MSRTKMSNRFQFVLIVLQKVMSFIQNVLYGPLFFGLSLVCYDNAT